VFGLRQDKQRHAFPILQRNVAEQAGNVFHRARMDASTIRRFHYERHLATMDETLHGPIFPDVSPVPDWSVEPAGNHESLFLLSDPAVRLFILASFPARTILG
jgi:hypothetical protein